MTIFSDSIHLLMCVCVCSCVVFCQVKYVCMCLGIYITCLGDVMLNIGCPQNLCKGEFARLRRPFSTANQHTRKHTNMPCTKVDSNQSPSESHTCTCKHAHAGANWHTFMDVCGSCSVGWALESAGKHSTRNIAQTCGPRGQHLRLCTAASKS
jgi:hypothetical protein